MKYIFWFLLIVTSLHANFIEKGIKAAKQGNTQKAIKFFEQSCKRDNPLGCYDAGIALLDIHKKNEAQTFFLKAKKLSEKRCAMGAFDACNLLGLMYGRGVGVKQDYQKSIKYLKKSCDKGNIDGCTILGMFYVEAGDYSDQAYTHANIYLKKACDLGSDRGCYELGWSYYKGEGVDKNKDKAKELFKRSCKLGYKTACKKYKSLLE